MEEGERGPREEGEQTIDFCSSLFLKGLRSPLQRSLRLSKGCIWLSCGRSVVTSACQVPSVP